jgi:hypothetical protein
MLRPSVDGPVYRLRPDRQDRGVLAPYTAGQTLFSPDLTRRSVAARYAQGGQIHLRARDQGATDGEDLLFVIRVDGQLVPTTGDEPPDVGPDDRIVLLDTAMPRPRVAPGEPAQQQ